MPRKSRLTVVGVPEHIIQRGIKRQAVFLAEDDMQAYVAWLEEYAKKYQVAIHAWVLMPNHVHLLCTPASSNSISRMMQSIGRMYVQYFNRKYKRSGTLWEGRFKSCLLEEKPYLLPLYRYIELNPVRAGLVDEPMNYVWSSYQCNALGKSSEWLCPHPIFMALGTNDEERQCAYRELFKEHIEGTLLSDIRQTLNKSLVLGSEDFVKELEALTGKILKAGKRGRPVGWRKVVKST